MTSRDDPWKCEGCGWTNLGYVPTCDGCGEAKMTALLSRAAILAAISLVDEPYPLDVFPDLQERDAVFAAMRAVNKYATEQFYAETARARGAVVRAELERAALAVERGSTDR